MNSKQRLKADAMELRDNSALNNILDAHLNDLIGQFLTTPEDKLVELKFRCNAIHELRSYINNEVTDILETV